MMMTKLITIMRTLPLVGSIGKHQHSTFILFISLFFYVCSLPLNRGLQIRTNQILGKL